MAAERVYKYLDASSSADLAREIELAIRRLEAQHEWVTVLSVSHALLTGYAGNILWTAFITCLVEGVKPPPSDT